MTEEAFIKQINLSSPELPDTTVLAFAAYVHNGKTEWDDSDDLNSDFREELVEQLFEFYDKDNRAIIRFLLQEELKYASAITMMRETLRQLTFMLYYLGYVEDLPLLIEAKLDCCFDASCALDQELILGRDKAAAIAYFSKYPHEDYDVLAIIEEYEQHGLRNPEQFISDMKSYYSQE